MNNPNPSSETFDLLVFAVSSDGELTSFVVWDITVDDLGELSSSMINHDYQLNGAVELAREQTHFRTTQIMQPKSFMVVDDTFGFKALHELPIWDMETGLTAYDIPESQTEDKSDDIPEDPAETCAESLGGDVETDPDLEIQRIEDDGNVTLPGDQPEDNEGNSD